MAMIHLSDEQFAALQQLSSEQGMAPDDHVASLIDEAIARDQEGFWVADIHEKIEQSLRGLESEQRRILSEEEFLKSLDDSRGERDANS